ncbi:uncharacterized protein FIBRA_07345 [Fibroporia radiculosa]|uniref:SWIM-type domain-containing protein n=1 Tax=Fibroporia radiculosa TaxID=599839 RepID=J4I0I9_9APHY|nr:uncharacterized protein FIBRA_07345 [Fibroporia radiculosa]CCM05137.1 predicted protein [Fibroporia radiculosa]
MPKRKALEDDYESWMLPHPAPARSRSYTSAASSYTPAQPVSASSRAVGHQQPQEKRQRNQKDPDTPASEKRGAIFKKKCPKNILERLDRVISQRFYMVDRKRESNELREEFSVLGSTGNVYSVIIDKRPSCNCPDATKGNHCKHILFVFLKGAHPISQMLLIDEPIPHVVLQVTQASGYWYQKALLTSELDDIFQHAPRAPNDVTNAHVREAYARATGKAIASSSKLSKDQAQKKRIPGPDDDCPICYENMHKVAENTLVFCDSCRNSLHKDCFQQWAVAARQKGQIVSCVFCRAKWAEVGSAVARATADGAHSSEGYLNLGSAAGLSPVRDTSSYYHGPTKGRRYYGYQEYTDHD